MMPYDRRLSVRKTPKHIGYLSLPRDNGGFVIDISEGGLGFQAIAPLNADGPIQIRFAIDSAERIRVFAELAWIDETRKAGGLRFLKLPDAARAQIRAWIGLPEEAAAVDIPAAEPAGADSAPAPAHTSPPTSEVEPFQEPVIESVAEPIAGSADRPNDEPLAELMIEPVAEPAEVVSCGADSATAELAPLTESVLETPVTDPVMETAPSEPVLETALSEPVMETALPELVMEAEPEAPSGFPALAEIDVSPAATTDNPILPEFRTPVFSGTATKFSMFAADTDSDADILTVGPSPSLTTKHPVAAVALTVVLAFLTSVPISAYVSTSRAGDFLFAWSQKMRRTPASQTVPQPAALPAGSTDNLPPQ